MKNKQVNDFTYKDFVVGGKAPLSVALGKNFNQPNSDNKGKILLLLGCALIVGISYWWYKKKN